MWFTGGINGVLREMNILKKHYSVFQWLDFKVPADKQYSKIINGNRIKEIYHFSAFQKSFQIKVEIIKFNHTVHFPKNSAELI